MVLQSIFTVISEWAHQEFLWSCIEPAVSSPGPSDPDTWDLSHCCILSISVERDSQSSISTINLPTPLISVKMNKKKLIIKKKNNKPTHHSQTLVSQLTFSEALSNNAFLFNHSLHSVLLYYHHYYLKKTMVIIAAIYWQIQCTRKFLWTPLSTLED